MNSPPVTPSQPVPHLACGTCCSAHTKIPHARHAVVCRTGRFALPRGGVALAAVGGAVGGGVAHFLQPRSIQASFPRLCLLGRARRRVEPHALPSARCCHSCTATSAAAARQQARSSTATSTQRAECSQCSTCPAGVELRVFGVDKAGGCGAGADTGRGGVPRADVAPCPCAVCLQCKGGRVVHTGRCTIHRCAPHTN